MTKSEEIRTLAARRVSNATHTDLRRLLDALQEGGGILRDGRWEHVNPSLARLLGPASPDDFVGAEVFWSAPPSERVVLEQHLERARVERASRPGVVRLTRRGGGFVALELSLVAIDDPGGVETFAVIARDPTERRRFFNNFAAADRSATLGALAASIAHGVNTPLAQVHSYASFVKDIAQGLVREFAAGREPPDASALRTRLRGLLENIGLMHEGVLAVANITRSLGLFTLQSEAEGRPVELGRILDAAVDLTENIIRHRARLACEIATLPPVEGSEARIGHLLLSTLLASAQAIPEGDAKNHELRLCATPDGDDVRIEVTDTGEARDDPDDATDPVSTVNRAVSPRALALMICRALAAETNATLEVTPLERGTRVTLRLPAARRVTPQAAPSAPPERASGPKVTHGRVLLIDDDPVLLDLVCRILKLDHEVEGTADPYDALARIERGERYDVILCDLMMPTMSGADLHARIARIAPHVARKMVFLTAGAFTEKARTFLASGEVSWFEKPIEPDRLRKIIRDRVAAVR